MVNWIPGVLIAVVGFNVAAVLAFSNEGDSGSFRQYISFSLLLILPTVIIYIFSRNIWYSLLAIIITLISGVASICIIPINKKAVELSQDLFTTFKVIDEGISKVFTQTLEKKPTEAILTNIIRLYDYVIDGINKMIDLNPRKDDSHIILLRAEDGKFRILANFGVSQDHQVEIEEKFSFRGDEPCGIASLAVKNKTDIYISDLSIMDESYKRSWVQIGLDDDKHGSLLCKVIAWGSGSSNSQILGVLCLTSRATHAFEYDKKKNLRLILDTLIEKIEHLMYISILLDKMD